jgi:hypothetical protein
MALVAKWPVSLQQRTQSAASCCRPAHDACTPPLPPPRAATRRHHWFPAPPHRFCFYDRAMQVDNGGGHETSLGVWKGFNKDGTEVRRHLPLPWRTMRVRCRCRRAVPGSCGGLP